MHIGFRYHVASLVAVFFSLFLGMLMGSALFQDDRLVEEQGHIINDLENQFRITEARIKVLQDNIREYERKIEVITEGFDHVTRFLVRQRLEETSVILTGANKKTDWERIEKVLRFAGATVKGVFPLDGTWELEDTKNRVVVLVWADEYLVEEHLLRLKDKLDPSWEVAFLQPFSCQETFPNIGDSLFVDIADTPVGELALVEGLSQSLQGQFGAKEGALALLPPLPSEKVIP